MYWTRRAGLLLIAALLLAVPVWDANGKEKQPPLETVASVDLNKYVGVWYEIARYPNRFQKSCVGNVTATYRLRDDGKVEVLNACLESSGKTKTAKGKAKIQDKRTNAKLKVTFFWPFYGDYWIIDLGQNYDYAVVSEPGREYLWILSRSPNMDEAEYQRILSRLGEQGFDTARLVKTAQR